MEAQLAIIGGERDLIVKEQAGAEARIRNAKLEELKRRRWLEDDEKNCNFDSKSRKVMKAGLF